MIRILLLGLALLIPSCLPALTCGSFVSGTVTLTANLVCNFSTALVVVGDNTTINLNGFNLICVGPGFMGSCQKTVDGAATNDVAGVQAGEPGYKNVRVNGPGMIWGFTHGVLIRGGTGHRVSGVTISGPKVSKEQNQRHRAIGVRVEDVPCLTTPLLGPRTVSMVISSNTIEAQVEGVTVHKSGCVDVKNNVISGNNGRLAARGVFLSDGIYNFVYNNLITHNGLNRNTVNFDAAVMVASYEGTTNAVIHQVTNNTVNDNCGFGVVLGPAAVGTTVASNVAKGNGLAQGDVCEVPQPNTFFDMAQLAPNSNTWNANNACWTQNGLVPAGVCHAGE